jgi:phage baseplate assembly protein W
MADDAAYVRGLVEQVLFTAPGERINRPDFGSGVGRLVFAPTDDALAQSTQALVHGALQRWLGDLVRVENVRVSSVDSRLEVVVEYLPLTASGSEGRRTVTVSGGVP